MPKTNFSRKIKIVFLNIMQAMGAAASHLASNAKLRVAEINLESRRHELLTEFSLQAFELWHNGVKLPEELSAMFTEISEIDDRLSLLRAQKYAKVKGEGEEPRTDDAEAQPPVCTPPTGEIANSAEMVETAEEPGSDKPSEDAPKAKRVRKPTRLKAKE